jgi:CRP-like cAMP-binding protein
LTHRPLFPKKKKSIQAFERPLRSTMAVLEPERPPAGNRFVDVLSADVAAALTRAADLRVLPGGTLLARRGDPIRELYLPLSGAITHLEEHADGRSAEVASIGSAGISGFEALLGEPRAQWSRVTVVPSSAFVLELAWMRRLYAANEDVRSLISRYAVASIRLAGISAACERHHYLSARLARWLLQLHDHVGTLELAITQDYAAKLLGAQRSGVTRAYAELARSGSVRWDRRRLVVRDSSGLEPFACGCYAEAKVVVDGVYRPRLA